MFKYLNKTSDYGLMFGKQKSQGGEALKGYVDYDFARSLDTRKSITCFIFTLYRTPISWKSTLQSVVVLSTTESSRLP